MKAALLTMVAALAVSATGHADESCDMTLPQMQAAMNLASQAYAKAVMPRLAARGLRLRIGTAHVVQSQTTGMDQIEISTMDGRVVALRNNPVVDAVGTNTKRGLQCQALMQTDGILAVYDAKSDAQIMSFMSANDATDLSVQTQSVMNF